MKTEKGFKFGLINQKEIHVSSLSQPDSEGLVSLSLSLQSRKQVLNNLNIDVLFLPFNDKRIVLQSYITT